jgi:hypothetical protein
VTLRVRILAVIAAIVAAALAIGVWVLRGPSPLAFAGGTKVALADYRGANPTGVPATLAQASLVERGEYLTKAADCTACHTKPGGQQYAGGLGFNLPFGTLSTLSFPYNQRWAMTFWSAVFNPDQ